MARSAPIAAVTTAAGIDALDDAPGERAARGRGSTTRGCRSGRTTHTAVRREQRPDRRRDRGQAVRLQADEDDIGVGRPRRGRRWRPDGSRSRRAGSAPARRARPSPAGARRGRSGSRRRRAGERRAHVRADRARAEHGEPHPPSPSSRAAMRERCTFPVGVFGISSRMWIRSGTLKAASERRASLAQLLGAHGAAEDDRRGDRLAVLAVVDAERRPPRPPAGGPAAPPRSRTARCSRRRG